MDRQRGGEGSRPEAVLQPRAGVVPGAPHDRYRPLLNVDARHDGLGLTRPEMDALWGRTRTIGDNNGRSYFDKGNAKINQIIGNITPRPGEYLVMAFGGLMSDGSGRGVGVGQWEFGPEAFGKLVNSDASWNRHRDPRIHLLISNGAREGSASIAAAVARECRTPVIGYTSDLWFPGGNKMICSPAVNDRMGKVTYERDEKKLMPYDSLLVEFRPNGRVRSYRHAYPINLTTRKTI